MSESFVMSESSANPIAVLNRSSNGSPQTYDSQEGRSCYAHAAASAYINTCNRIYGLTPRIPSHDECVAVADYNHGTGGYPERWSALLEEQFGCGIRSEVFRTKPTINDIFALLIIASLKTNRAG
jgi:hypothetical protein